MTIGMSSFRVPCILLLCLSHVLAQDIAKPASGKLVQPASDLAGDVATSNHLFKDNKGNHKANLVDARNATGMTIEPVKDDSVPKDMKNHNNTSNFLVTQVAAFMQKVFGNITRHSSREPQRQYKAEKNATVAEPAGHNTTGTRSMHPHLLHRFTPKPADLGGIQLPQRRNNKPYRRLNVLPRVKKARVVPDEA